MKGSAGSGHGGGPRAESRGEILLRASKYFLCNRDFRSCQTYAVQALKSDRGNPAAEKIIAVADVLAASETRFNDSRHDWYAILGVKQYSEDSQLIRDRFKYLLPLLNPNTNKFPFADQAFALVRNAWAVLSCPQRKNQFDNELKILESWAKSRQRSSVDKVEDQRGTGNDTFWTMCPYCYYVYEFSRVYEEYCLRCQNQKCKRGFHAAAIFSPPPPAVVESGQYWCLGFHPSRFEGAEGKGFSSWTPFAPMSTGTPEAELDGKNGVSHNGNGQEGDRCFEISDDSDKSCDDLVKAGAEIVVDAHCKKAQTEVLKKGDDNINVCATKIRQIYVPDVVNPQTRKRKSVAKNTKKIMGKGTRIKRNEAFPGLVEGLDFNVDANNYDESFASEAVRG
ncbi:hypothetical protein NMG60_11007459 [Bertholletia excelsa]